MKSIQGQVPSGLLTMLMLFLTVTLAEGAAILAATRGPYLQQATTNSVVVRWRTSAATNSFVRFGESPDAITNAISDPLVQTDHIVTVMNLQPDAKYYYEIGTSAGWFAGDTNDFFVTSPPVAFPKPTRIWVIGDFGSGNSTATAVLDAYLSFTGTRPTDVWITTGDNAYSNGTDSQYQKGLFNAYPELLRNTFIWPSLGNHDAKSKDPMSNTIFSKVFTLPANGEAGGVASGSELYYSFDYANIHFICLDSALSDNSTNGPMCTWLRSDLAATLQEWVIAYWHHSPYSKGTHSSDTDGRMVQMRQNVVPILEDYGVDLVLTGHSHDYERSYLIDGHYGKSGTFTQSMKKNGGDGRENCDGPYVKPEGRIGRQGAVYAVVGNSGNGYTPGHHPAMLLGLGDPGSAVIDVVSNRLDFLLLRKDGTIGDYFTMLKGVSAEVNPPTAPGNLVATAVGTNQIELFWTDTAADEKGFAVERFATGVGYEEIADVGANVNNGADTGLAPNTTYSYRVRAYNAAGDSPYSNIAQATTFPLPNNTDSTAPGAVTNLLVSGLTSDAVTLNWTAVGDDGAAGTATRYQIRFSTEPITETNWFAAITVGGLPTPLPPGAMQDVEIGGISAGTTYYFALKTYDEENNLSPLSNVASATTAGVPEPWFDADIGATNFSGQANHTNETFTVQGAGADIGGKADAFHFVYQPGYCDCEIIARVTGVQNTSTAAKAGVMIRETLNANSRFAMALLTPAKKVQSLNRTTTGGSASTSSASGSSAPYWLRIVRAGNTFTSYRSADGVAWIKVTSQAISMGPNAYIGLAVTSKNVGMVNTSTFDNVVVTP